MAAAFPQQVPWPVPSALTSSQPRNLLSIARLNMAKSVRFSRSNLARIAQTWLGRSGGFGPVSLAFIPGRSSDAGSGASFSHGGLLGSETSSYT